jgi:hypothetical protein
MATLIIEIVSKNVNSLCLTEAQVTARNIFAEEYGKIFKKITIDDADATKVLRNKWIIKSISDSDEVTYEDLEINTDDGSAQPITIPDQADFDSKRDGIISIMNRIMILNPSNSMVSDMTTYKNALEGIDSSAISYPIANSFEGYVDSIGISPLHELQLP